MSEQSDESHQSNDDSESYRSDIDSNKEVGIGKDQSIINNDDLINIVTKSKKIRITIGSQTGANTKILKRSFIYVAHGKAKIYDPLSLFIFPAEFGPR